MEITNITDNRQDYSKLTGPLPHKLTNDYMFKAFLQKNEKALRGLLCALLRMKDTDIKSVAITNPIILGERITDKYVILDIKLLLNDNTIINIEMQVENLKNWPERSLTYLCKNYDQLKTGEDYKESKKAIQIGILDFTIDGFPQELFLDYYFVNQKTNHIYSDKVSILVLQLNQLGKEKDEASMPDLYHWAQLFSAKTWEEIIMLAEKNKEISECIVTLKELSEDEKIQMECEAREKARRDAVAREDYITEKALKEGFSKGHALGLAAGHAQGLAEGHTEGHAKGHAKGRAEGRAEGITNLVSTLRELNISDNQIIEKLKEKYNLSDTDARKYL